MKARYFGEDVLEENAVDAAVQDMARRQFAISAVVAVALMAVGGYFALTATQPPAMEPTIAHHKILKPGAPQLEFAQPSIRDGGRG